MFASMFQKYLWELTSGPIEGCTWDAAGTPFRFFIDLGAILNEMITDFGLHSDSFFLCFGFIVDRICVHAGFVFDRISYN